MIDIEIKLAKHMGFCYGVHRAVEMTETILNENEGAYINGMLIHNSDEMNRLNDLGLEIYEEGKKNKSNMILRSHGTEKSVKENFSKEFHVIDTVCPYVRTVQNYAKRYKDDSLIIFGDKNHPEVKSINSYSDYSAHVAKNVDELSSISEDISDKYNYIVLQTTFKRDVASDMLEYLDSNNIKYKYIDTICNATKDRVDSTFEVAKSVECMIILGDSASSNCTKLYEYAKMYCEKVFFIKSIEEMEISEILVYNSIGISAGASTPDWIIKEAIDKMENLNKSEMMEAIESSFTKIKRGDILKGTVLYVNDSEVSVNINYRTDGIINRDEVSQDPSEKPSDLFKTGDEIDVYVLKMDDGQGNVVLSHKRVQNLKYWDVIQEKFNNNEIVNALVIEVAKGGLKCEVDGISAFMPASQVSVTYKKDLSQYVDKELASRIIDFNKEKRRIILSRKVVEKEELDALKEKVYSSIQVGDIIEGTVQRLTNFGAFVDIGGIDGLIHISELSWNRVKHPSDVVQPNQKVMVQVLEVNPEKDRVALGLKQTTKEPWEMFVEEYIVGDVVKGNVVNLLDFGAFVKLPTGVDGLLHVSQIAKEHIEKPSDKLTLGEEIEVIITDINEDDRKVSLSIKELLRQRAKEEKRNAEESEEGYDAEMEAAVEAGEMPANFEEDEAAKVEAEGEVAEVKEETTAPKEEVVKVEPPTFEITIGDMIKKN